jgi:hypothetical protein
LGFFAFSGVSRDGSSKTLQKTFYKKGVSKRFYQKNDKKNKTGFFSIFYHVYGRFSVRGGQKHDKKSPKKTDQPWYFFGLRATNQPRQGPSFVFLRAPCLRAAAKGPPKTNR